MLMIKSKCIIEMSLISFCTGIVLAGVYFQLKRNFFPISVKTNKSRFRIILRDKFTQPEIVKKIENLKKMFLFCPLSGSKLNLKFSKINGSCSM